MNKKLYTVEITTEIVVLAESASEAEEIAQDNLRELSGYEFGYSGSKLRWLPTGWEESALAYGDDTETPIGDLIKAGAAPEYRK